MAPDSRHRASLSRMGTSVRCCQLWPTMRSGAPGTPPVPPAVLGGRDRALPPLPRSDAPTTTPWRLRRRRSGRRTPWRTRSRGSACLARNMRRRLRRRSRPRRGKGRSPHRRRHPICINRVQAIGVTRARGPGADRRGVALRLHRHPVSVPPTLAVGATPRLRMVSKALSMNHVLTSLVLSASDLPLVSSVGE